MKIIPEIKSTFGDTYFLGYTEKKKYDKDANRKTDEVESYICRLSSSELQGQIDVSVPPTADIGRLKFNQKVFLQDVVIEPYAKSSQGTSFAEVILRCTAKEILDNANSRPSAPKSE